MIPVKHLEIYSSPKILSMQAAATKISELKATGKLVGLCHGGFDLTHPGHMKHFEEAKKHCDVLVVSLTADRFVVKRKGDGRPVYTENLRAYMAAACQWVDYVLISDFAKGVETIHALKPNYYIKGPDYIHKTTPGITSERNAIAKEGGDIKYTTEPPMSTTKLIEYIQDKIPDKKLLIVIDRDGTLIEDSDFPGRSEQWREELRFKEDVISYLSALQTKYKTTKILVSNQQGVARGYFDCTRVEELNAVIAEHLFTKGIKIDSWQYCPDVDARYAEAKQGEVTFVSEHVKDKTKRKPSPAMVEDALQELNKNRFEFKRIVVLGDREDDRGLAENLGAIFVDVTGKSYEELCKNFM